MITTLDPSNLTGETVQGRKWSCLWRPDVGSSLYARSSWQKAGGVGGLAWLQTGNAQNLSTGGTSGAIVTGSGEVHIPMADHMGNIRHHVHFRPTTSTGPYGSYTNLIVSQSANFEYDAFGREVRANGTTVAAPITPPGLTAGTSYADALPFHFSSKFTDPESALNYYGYRYYDPKDGRWLNRDPMGEKGGLNLYGFVGNDRVNRSDFLGLQCGPAGYAMDGHAGTFFRRSPRCPNAGRKHFQSKHTIVKTFPLLLQRLVAVALAVFVIEMANGSSDEDRAGFRAFTDYLAIAAKQPLHSGLDETAIFSAKRAFNSDKEASAESMASTLNRGLDLWIADQRDYLLLSWHRTNSRQKRLLIAALFICERIERLRDPLDGRTDFETAPARYKDTEASDRMEELAYVKKHARTIAKQLHAALSTILPGEKVAGFAYTAALSDSEYAVLLKEAEESLDRERKKLK